MKIDFNGIMREMTIEEIKELDCLTNLFPENNDKDNYISERISNIEKQIENTNTEITSLRKIMNIIKYNQK